MIECLYLIKSGVPFDVAFSIRPVWRRAFVVALGEINGAQYNWHTLAWEHG